MLTSCQYIDYLNRIKQFFERVKSGYHNGKPLHIADPEHSGFAIVSAENFGEMSAQGVQELIRHKNVVITGCQYPPLKFDEAGLRTLAPLDSQVSLIGMILICYTNWLNNCLDYTFPPAARGQNTTPATISGLVTDLLDNARNPDGKILNAIDFPACFTAWDDIPNYLSFATDVVAWDYLRGKPYCGNFTNQYPIAHMRWGLAGTANAVTFIHIDSDGYATFVRVTTGMKVWGILPNHQLSSIDAFLNDFLLDEIASDSTFPLEAIVLCPGDAL